MDPEEHPDAQDLDEDVEGSGSEVGDEEEVEPDDPPLPEFVQALIAADLISDDLDVAEISATSGPTYDLDELDVETVDSLCAHLDGAGAQWAIDRAGSLVVHRNDERRADAVFVELFGPDDELADSPEAREVRGEVETLAARVETRPVDPVQRRRWWQR